MATLLNAENVCQWVAPWDVYAELCICLCQRLYYERGFSLGVSPQEASSDTRSTGWTVKVVGFVCCKLLELQGGLEPLRKVMACGCQQHIRFGSWNSQSVTNK